MIKLYVDDDTVAFVLVAVRRWRQDHEGIPAVQTGKGLDKIENCRDLAKEWRQRPVAGPPSRALPE
jgi:hypothetical protein